MTNFITVCSHISCFLIPNTFYERLDGQTLVRRQLAASDAALTACWTAHELPVGRANVQDSADVISAVSEPAHLVAHQRTQHSIVVCFLLLSANYSAYLFRQRLCSCLTALWRYINFVLLLFLLLFTRCRLSSGLETSSSRTMGEVSAS